MMHVRRSQSGFTLVEVLVTMSIVAILMMVVVPSFASAFLSNKLSSYANGWIANVQLARSEAIKRNAVVTLCASADGKTCAPDGNWQQGWLVKASDGTIVNRHEALSGDYSFTGSDYSLDFQPSGVGSTTASVTLCRMKPTPGTQEKVILLNTLGRTSVTTTRTGVCS